MYSEETKSSTLAKFFAIYDYVFVDTCSLMEDSFPSFMDTLQASKEYWKDGFKVIVLGECVQELKKHVRGKDNQEAHIEAKRAFKILRHDRWHGKTLSITKSNSNYGFADNAIFSTVSSLRIQKKILIITQDKTLATDLRKLNNLDSQRGRYVEVFRLNANGELEENPGEQFQSRNSEGRYVAKTNIQMSHEKHSFFHHDNHAENKPIVSEASVNSPLPASSPILDQDRRLSANLANPNYPLDKKLVDIDKQLGDLNALSSDARNHLSLAYTPEQLASEKAKLSTQTPKASATPPAFSHKETPVVAKSVTPSNPPQPVKTQVEEKPLAAVVPVAKGWFEYGKTVEEGLTKCGVHHNWIFRDPSVPYFAAVHGPYDITRLDLSQVALQVQNLKPGESKDVSFKGLVAHIEKTPLDYKCFLETASNASAKPLLSPARSQEVKPETKEVKAQSAKEAVKPISKDSVKKTRVPRVAEKSLPAKKETKPVSSSKPTESVGADPTVKPLTSNGGLAATPSGATLIVGVPSDQGKKAYIERRSRREDNPEVTIIKNVGSAPAKKAVLPKSVVRKAIKTEQPVASKPAADKTAHSSDYDVAIKEDNDLNAKLNNPTYPKESAIKALQAQEGRIRKLKPGEDKGLHYTTHTIEAKLKDLKAK
jgi:rRNA-processing protein FCF1